MSPEFSTDETGSLKEKSKSLLQNLGNIFEIFRLQIMFFEKVIEIGTVLSGKFGCIADISLADFKKLDQIAFFIGVPGLLEGL